MPLAPGDKLGPYEITALLGEGGMGEVYKARDTRLDRAVALKVSKAQFTDRFEREARAVAALNHPNICQLYDVGPNYLVMEFVEGAELKGPLPLDRALEVSYQILDALDAAHKRGITHRDLKPANVLVAKQGIKLLDFGLAKQEVQLAPTDATLTKALTSEGQLLGTLQYMSPEQTQGENADARSDIFAFGCVFHELITGKRAFNGASVAAIIAAILKDEPEPRAVPEAIDRVIKTCLAKDADARFQSAADCKRALHWATEAKAASPV
ncbi:MAG: serine/threonine protein kinase, partial [Acidobacteria bacterium]|nr:serine/threonine protein kinase [Acidobacteriota bacterium]